MILRPITSEKAVRMIDIDNIIMFETERQSTRDSIKKEIEKIFNVKVTAVRTMIRHNKKIAYVKLHKSNPAIDVASKLGMI